MVINTNPDVCDRDLISDTPASVDFGTSSTCVAIEGDEKTELLSLSSNDILENVVAGGGIKQGDEITVTIEGDLP